jgi:hypothetical protein
MRALRMATFVSAALLAGCGPGYRVAEVDGLLTIQGKPGKKVNVQFVPDIDKETKGPLSSADTDDEGRFTLVIRQNQDQEQSGAVVGWHRVVFSDLQLAESPTGRGVPLRFKDDYLRPNTTPVRQQVVDGKQTIKIDIP